MATTRPERAGLPAASARRARDDDELARYPLRQSLTAAPETLAALRRSGLLEWLTKPECCLLVDDEDRITICAAHEDALEQAVAFIMQAHGASVKLDAPQVHGVPDHQGGGPLQPLMFVRAQVPRAHAAQALEELVRRHANVLENDLQTDCVVLRAEVRLADLLGYPVFLRELTGGTAALWIWLLRYAPGRA
ncbi:hypothetical protein AB4Z46_07050 [Variovorax sp. M-6]|uniref:hypothetical protein n=1 Tax=Variovorax sp. M-6 TaxID=3233041 RepID=UPI003F961C04